MHDPCHPLSIQIAAVPENVEHVRAVIKRRGKIYQLARIAPEDPMNPQRGCLHFEWLVPNTTAANRNIRQSIYDSLHFFCSIEIGPTIWPYLIHHTTTASNLYSRESGNIYWEWIQNNPDSL